MKNRTRKRVNYWKLLAVVTGALVLLLAAALFVFSRYLAAFEASRPDKVAEAYLAETPESVWEELVKTGVAALVSEREDPDEISSACWDAVAGGTRSVRHKSGFTADEPEYVVRIGASDVASLKLLPCGKAGFGFNLWEAGTPEFLESFVPEARDVTIVVPENCLVEVNGSALDASLITDSVTDPSLSELEKSFTTELPCLVTYTVPGMLGNISLSVTAPEGPAPLCTTADGTSYVYERVAADRYAVTATVPAGSTLLVNGSALDETYLVSAGTDSLLEGTSAAATEVYAVKGLTVPVESVEALSAEGRSLWGKTNGDSRTFWPDTGEIPADVRTRTVEFMNAYFLYSSDLHDETASHWNALRPYLLANSDAYLRLYAAMSGLVWTKSSDASMTEPEFRSYASLAEDRCTVCLTVTETVTRATGTVTSTLDYRLVLVLAGGEWVVERMETV